MTDIIDQFVQTLQASAADLTISVDRALDPEGEVFIDLSTHGVVTTIAYRRQWGFGFFNDASGYGESPDRRVISADEAAIVALALLRRAPKAESATRKPAAARRNAG